MHTKSVYNGSMKNSQEPTTLHKRINITLPQETLALIDRVSGERNRSSFINYAVKRYIDEAGRTKIKAQLKEGSIKRAEFNLGIAEDWFDVEEDVWQTKR